MDFFFVCADNGNVLVPANYEKKRGSSNLLYLSLFLSLSIFSPLRWDRSK